MKFTYPIILIITFLFTLNSYAFNCNFGQYVSRFDSNRQLSEEEISGNYEYVDVLSHLEGKIDNELYSINSSMELKKHIGKKKSIILKFNSKNWSEDSTVVSVFKFGKFHFFEIGFNSYMEGYLSSIIVVDLKKKKILSEFDKCANHNEFFGLSNGVLTYMCEPKCNENEYFIFDAKEKKFIKITKKHDCNKLSPNPKLVGLKLSKFKLRYKKDKNGVEYKSSRLPFIEKNCKKSQ